MADRQHIVADPGVTIDSIRRAWRQMATILNSRIDDATDTAEAATSVGDIKIAAGAVPSGWLACDGSAVSRVTYARLFAVIGTANGAGDGSTTFNLPNIRAVVVDNTSDTLSLDNIQKLSLTFIIKT